MTTSVDLDHLSLRRATLADTRFVFDCRAAVGPQATFRSGGAEDYGAHAAWMEQAVTAESVLFFIACDSDTEVGYVRFNATEPAGSYTTSICLHPDRRRAGMGTWFLEKGCRAAAEANARRLLACINSKNLPSLAIFLKCGFRCIFGAATEDGFVYLVKELSDATDEDKSS